MSSDQQLWQALKQGDKTALASIYQQEVAALYRYGCQFTADKSLVEDAIQDLFIELWKNRSRLGTTDAIRQYLLVALRRKVIRLLQQGSRREDRHLKVVATTTHTAAVDESIIQQEEERDQQRMVSNALNALSERQREILYLKYFEGFDYPSIAEMLGINYQSVRNTASAGMKALRKIITLIFILLSSL